MPADREVTCVVNVYVRLLHRVEMDPYRCVSVYLGSGALTGVSLDGKMCGTAAQWPLTYTRTLQLYKKREWMRLSWAPPAHLRMFVPGQWRRVLPRSLFLHFLGAWLDVRDEPDETKVGGTGPSEISSVRSHCLFRLVPACFLVHSIVFFLLFHRFASLGCAVIYMRSNVLRVLSSDV